jgi:hypothetical protein
MLLEARHGIARARRLEPAEGPEGVEERRKQPLVQPHEHDEQAGEHG